MIRALAVALALALGACRQAPAGAEKPPLMLLTSLPILFGEDFSLEPPPSPLRDALEARFMLRPIDLADRASLGDGRLLLMAQPRAQTAEALVDLDAWIRGGGKLLLLADPRLHWPSRKSLGDRTAPMLAFADTGLLRHWGVTLYLPEGQGTVGSLESAPGSGCRVEPAGDIAHCALGQGRVTIIADADLVRDEKGATRVANELVALAAR